MNFLTGEDENNSDGCPTDDLSLMARLIHSFSAVVLSIMLECSLLDIAKRFSIDSLSSLDELSCAYFVYCMILS